MTRFSRRLRSERGAALIHVAIAVFALTGFSTFVLDHGVMWLARGQAQNAADAGALAGAIARAFDETDDPPADDGAAFDSAFNAAQANLVLGQTPGVAVNWECPAFLPGEQCVRVDAFRDGTSGSTALPTFFANMFGLTSQPVRATATARVAYGNATNCMRPFAVADKWVEQVSPSARFNHWVKVSGNPSELNPHDTYVPPGNSGSTGYKVTNPDGTIADYGTELALKAGNPAQSESGIEPGWFLATQLPDGEGGWYSGANDYKWAIANCIGNPVAIGDYLPTETGVMIGPTSQGFTTLKARDPFATWNATTKQIDDTCAPDCAAFSPRIIPIAVFDMDDYQRRDITGDWGVCPIGGRCIKVVNILGFFASHLSGGDIVGYLVMYPGEFVVGPPAVGNNEAFLVTVQLVR
jgi:hypothetical protein